MKSEAKIIYRAIQHDEFGDAFAIIVVENEIGLQAFSVHDLPGERLSYASINPRLARSTPLV